MEAKKCEALVLHTMYVTLDLKKIGQVLMNAFKCVEGGEERNIMPNEIRAKDISAATIYRILRGVLDDVQDRIKWEEILMRHTLEGDLGLNAGGRGALAHHINEAFSHLGVLVSGSETRAAKTVEALHDLLMEKVFTLFPTWPEPK